MSIPSVGPTRADQALEQLGIARSKRVGGLGVRQRDKLREYLRAREGDTPVPRSRLVVLAGPTAVGKGTVSRHIRETYPDVLLSVSATTRAPRPGEVDGEHYYFVTRRAVRRAWSSAATSSSTRPSTTPTATAPRGRRSTRRSALGKSVLLEIDLQGARSVKAAMPEALLVFLLPPSWEELVRRLVGRGTEDAAEQARRLETATHRTRGLRTSSM